MSKGIKQHVVDQLTATDLADRDRNSGGNNLGLSIGRGDSRCGGPGRGEQARGEQAHGRDFML